VLRSAGPTRFACPRATPACKTLIIARCRPVSVVLPHRVWDQKQLPPVIDMARQRFGRLTVIRRAGITAGGIATWLCRCDCGNRTIVLGRNLRSGRTRSCGCYGRQTGTMNTTHGHAKHYRKSPEYSAWSSLIGRCYRPEHHAYRWYGGAGITVCKRWRTSFPAFLADMGLKPAPDFMLGRKHKDRNYTPSNCEWSIKRAKPSR
jgi:hypothetical protein